MKDGIRSMDIGWNRLRADKRGLKLRKVTRATEMKNYKKNLPR